MCLHLLPYSSNVINSVTHIASYMQSVGQRRDRRVAWHPIGGSHPMVWLSHLFPITSYTHVCAWLPGLLTFVSHIPVYTAPLCSSAKQHEFFVILSKFVSPVLSRVWYILCPLLPISVACLELGPSTLCVVRGYVLMCSCQHFGLVPMCYQLATNCGYHIFYAHNEKGLGSRLTWITFTTEKFYVVSRQTTEVCDGKTFPE